MIILAALFSSNFTMLQQLQPTYTQEYTTSQAAESQPSLTNDQWFVVFSTAGVENTE